MWYIWNDKLVKIYGFKKNTIVGYDEIGCWHWRGEFLSCICYNYSQIIRCILLKHFIEWKKNKVLEFLSFCELEFTFCSLIHLLGLNFLAVIVSSPSINPVTFEELCHFCASEAQNSVYKEPWLLFKGKWDVMKWNKHVSLHQSRHFWPSKIVRNN